jgi:DNA-binding transcriptional MerR regulator
VRGFASGSASSGTGAAEQLERGNRLIALKELGFGLDQIGPMLDARLSVAELRAMLLLRRAQVAEQIAADQTRLAEIERAVTVLHHGSMETIGDTWQALAHHLEEKGYQAEGIAREVYLHMPMDGDPATWVTEVQQPIA